MKYILIIMLALTFGCSAIVDETDEDDNDFNYNFETDSDTDTSSDGNSDTNTDLDADSDTDTDTDGDTNTDTFSKDCYENESAFLDNTDTDDTDTQYVFCGHEEFNWDNDTDDFEWHCRCRDNNIWYINRTGAQFIEECSPNDYEECDEYNSECYLPSWTECDGPNLRFFDPGGESTRSVKCIPPEQCVYIDPEWPSKAECVEI